MHWLAVELLVSRLSDGDKAACEELLTASRLKAALGEIRVVVTDLENS